MSLYFKSTDATMLFPYDTRSHINGSLKYFRAFWLVVDSTMIFLSFIKSSGAHPRSVADCAMAIEITWQLFINFNPVFLNANAPDFLIRGVKKSLLLEDIVLLNELDSRALEYLGSLVVIFDSDDNIGVADRRRDERISIFNAYLCI